MVWWRWGRLDSLKWLKTSPNERGLHHSLVIGSGAETVLENPEDEKKFRQALTGRAAYELCFQYYEKISPFLKYFNTFTCYGRMKLNFFDPVVLSKTDVRLWKRITRRASLAALHLFNASYSPLFYYRLFQVIKAGFKDITISISMPTHLPRQFLRLHCLSKVVISFYKLDYNNSKATIACFRVMCYANSKIEVVLGGSLLHSRNVLLFQLQPFIENNPAVSFNGEVLVACSAPYFMLRPGSNLTLFRTRFHIDIEGEQWLLLFCSKLERGEILLEPEMCKTLVSEINKFYDRHEQSQVPKKGISLRKLKQIDMISQAKRAFLRKYIVQQVA